MSVFKQPCFPCLETITTSLHDAPAGHIKNPRTSQNRGSDETLRVEKLGIALATLPDVRLATTPPGTESVIVRQSNESGPAVVAVCASGVSLEAVERALIVFALEANAGNRTRSARFLRLTRSALLYRMQKFGLKEKQES